MIFRQGAGQTGADRGTVLLSGQQTREPSPCLKKECLI